MTTSHHYFQSRCTAAVALVTMLLLLLCSIEAAKADGDAQSFVWVEYTNTISAYSDCDPPSDDDDSSDSSWEDPILITCEGYTDIADGLGGKATVKGGFLVVEDQTDCSQPSPYKIPLPLDGDVTLCTATYNSNNECFASYLRQVSAPISKAQKVGTGVIIGVTVLLVGALVLLSCLRYHGKGCWVGRGWRRAWAAAQFGGATTNSTSASASVSVGAAGAAHNQAVAHTPLNPEGSALPSSQLRPCGRRTPACCIEYPTNTLMMLVCSASLVLLAAAAFAVAFGVFGTPHYDCPAPPPPRDAMQCVVTHGSPSTLKGPSGCHDSDRPAPNQIATVDVTVRGKTLVFDADGETLGQQSAINLAVNTSFTMKLQQANAVPAMCPPQVLHGQDGTYKTLTSVVTPIRNAAGVTSVSIDVSSMGSCWDNAPAEFDLSWMWANPATYYHKQCQPVLGYGTSASKSCSVV